MPAAVRLRSPCAHLRQSGTGLNLDAPALVLGEVPMQHVHPVECQRLDLLLHEVHILEMAASVQQQSTVLEDRRILDEDTGQNESLGAPRFAFDRHHFAKGGPPAEPPGRCGGIDLHGGRVHLDAVSLNVLNRGVRLEDEARSSTGSFGQGQTRPLEPRLHDRAFGRPSLGPIDCETAVTHVRALTRFDRLGKGNQPLGRPHRAFGSSTGFEKEKKQKQGHRIPEPVRHHALKVGQRHEPPRPKHEPSPRPPGSGRHRRVGR